jgi:hypothetical protein
VVPSWVVGITSGPNLGGETQVAATFYTLMETAKLHGIDPTVYLLEAARAAARGEVLLPGDVTG